MSRAFLKTFLDMEDFEFLKEKAQEQGISPNQLMAEIVTDYVRLGKWRSDYVPPSHQEEVLCSHEEDS